MRAKDAAVLDWLDSHRLLVGAVLLVLLAIGFYGYWPFIRDEWPRLDDFHRAAIWIADLTAVALVVKWVFLDWDNDLAGRFPERGELQERRRQMRWISLSLLLSLAIDIGVTVHGIYVDKLASDRSLPAAATVVGVREVHWRPVVHYRLDVQFTDVQAQAHRGLLVFTTKPAGFPSWVDQRTRQAIAKGQQRFPIEIRYDPLRPARVWGAAEPWDRGSALGYGFAIIHFFQLTAIGFPCLAPWLIRGLRPAPVALRLMPMLSLAVQALSMAVWGSLFRFRGF
jgi:hypothetical protein